MPALIAAALVFLSSAAVLVLEILAARLLAPYVGNTLETYTAIIGVILGGIAVGSWLGGRAADRHDPRRLIGPLLIVGGALAFASIPVVDNLGAGLRGAGPATTTILTVLAFFLPAAVLSGVTPAVIKIQLASLDQTGRVVGQLSALSTAGAIIGTFVTGFLLVAALPTRPVVRGTAVFLVVLGIAAAIYLERDRPRRQRLPVGTLLAALGAAVFSFAATNPCEFESAYYCAYIEADPERPNGRALWLDTLRHSYVDLADDSHLEFTYTAWFGDVITAVAPGGKPLDSLHIGGGGFTMPRYLRAEHPGSTSIVLEVDPLLVELAKDELGLELRADITALTGDARLTIAQVPDGSVDLVVADAFGGIAVPWHLATREFTEEIHRTLRPGGWLVMNVIDYGERAFLRAEAVTIGDVFAHVAIVGRADAFGPPGPGVGGNHVVVASDAPLPVESIAEELHRGGSTDTLLHGAAFDAFTADALVLIDDFAPVDQLLDASPTR